jgi:hypothetical protein
MGKHGLYPHCDVKDCAREHFAKGYCSMHYRRWRRTGDPLVTLPKHKIVYTEEMRIQQQERMAEERQTFQDEYRLLRSYGLGHNEIAAKFGIKPDSLTTRLRRHRKKEMSCPS